MNILSFSFFGKKQFGGGRSAAENFKTHCEFLGHKCDLIDSEIYLDQWQSFNKYDFIFFSTPPRSKLMAYEIDRKIKKPFAIMIHDETDFSKYEGSFELLAANVNCIAIFHISPDGYYDDGPNQFHIGIFARKTIHWSPCLPAGFHKKTILPNKRENILFAGRVTAWKGIMLLDTYSRKFTSEKSFVFGKSYPCTWDEHQCNSFNESKYSRINKPFESIEKLRRYGDVFWDITLPRKINGFVLQPVKRINLSSLEALFSGFMPILNKDIIPPGLNDLFIECDLSKDEENILLEIKNQISRYRNKKNKMFEKAIQRSKNWLDWKEGEFHKQLTELLEGL